jgi:hypothetical protein
MANKKQEKQVLIHQPTLPLFSVPCPYYHAHNHPKNPTHTPTHTSTPAHNPMIFEIKIFEVLVFEINDFSNIFTTRAYTLGIFTQY